MKYLTCLILLATVPARAVDDKELVARFLKYRDLVRLTEAQVDMVESTRMSCADPRRIYEPHYQPGIHLYASAAAIEERRKNPESSHYPVGTLLVKEKFESKGGTTPDIITVMEKVTDTGKIDDWKFYMIRLADRTIVRDGLRVSCVSCHARYARTDFVSRETDSLMAEFVATQPQGSAKP